MAAALSSRSPADGSWQRKALLIAFALLMITPIEKGGAEHGYGAPRPRRGAMVKPPAAAPASAVAEAKGPLGGWSEAELRAAMSSPAYRDPQHPDHQRLQRAVRAWFERHLGGGPIPTDATGRAIRRSPETTPNGGACPVHVRG